MNYEFCTRTDPGLARENNEDSVTVDEPTRLGILADGMGGYNAGEIASGMATTFIKSELGRWLAQAGRHANAKEVRRAMEICVDNANRSIFNAANSNPQYSGMGTTLVVGVFQDGRLLLGHIGDSRCYRLRNERLELLTRDHSLLQEQLDAGAITPEQASLSPHRNLVTRALGIERHVELEMHEHNVKAGDVFLLCSDGLSEMVPEGQLFTILLQEAELSEKATLLVAAANENGGKDNISVVLARAGSSEAPQASE
jgi:PPM family protein phosphatase